MWALWFVGFSLHPEVYMVFEEDPLKSVTHWMYCKWLLWKVVVASLIWTQTVPEMHISCMPVNMFLKIKNKMLLKLHTEMHPAWNRSGKRRLLLPWVSPILSTPLISSPILSFPLLSSLCLSILFLSFLHLLSPLVFSPLLLSPPLSSCLYLSTPAPLEHEHTPSPATSLKIGKLTLNIPRWLASPKNTRQIVLHCETD